MKYIAFRLTMPVVTSWNGKWSGEGKCHAIVVKITEEAYKRRRKELDTLKGGQFTYEFSDGWEAFIDTSFVSEDEAKKLVKQSVGFAGYDWMVASILDHGKIVSSDSSLFRYKVMK